MPAVATPPAGAPAPTGGEGFFQRKVFGVKTWVLMLGLTIAILSWSLIKARKNGNASSTSSTTTGTNSGTNAQYTPPYVIETNVNEAPVNVTQTDDDEPIPVDRPPGGPPRRRPRPIKGPPPPVPGPPSSPPPSGVPVKSKPPAPGYTVYRVKPRDNLTTIARHFKVFQTNPNPGLALYNYQLTAGLRSPADQKTLRQRGPNLIFPNEEIYIPKN
jgi:hypothetical protein